MAHSFLSPAGITDGAGKTFLFPLLSTTDALDLVETQPVLGSRGKRPSFLLPPLPL